MVTIQLRWQFICAFLITGLILALPVATALASSNTPGKRATFPHSDTAVKAGLVISPDKQAADCASAKAIGVLGREGGLLLLLGVDGIYADPVTSMVKSNDYTLRLRHSEQPTTNLIIYMRADCLSHASELTFSSSH